jgi:hypothetical protein
MSPRRGIDVSVDTSVESVDTSVESVDTSVDASVESVDETTVVEVGEVDEVDEAQLLRWRKLKYSSMSSLPAE